MLNPAHLFISPVNPFSRPLPLTQFLSSFDSTKPQPAAASRYAKALYELAVERSQLDVVAADAANLLAVINGSEDLRRFLGNPLLRREALTRGLGTVLEFNQASALFDQFLRVAVRNGRARDIAAILAAFSSLLDRVKGRVTAHIVSAHPLSTLVQEKIAAALANALADKGVKQVMLDASVDESVLGGMRVQIGAWLYDGTLKGKLQQMGQFLKSS